MASNSSPRSPFRETPCASPNAQNNNNNSFFPADTPWHLDPNYPHQNQSTTAPGGTSDAAIIATASNTNNDTNDDEALTLAVTTSNDENSNSMTTRMMMTMGLETSYSHSPTKRSKSGISTNNASNNHSSSSFQGSHKSKSMDDSMISAMRHQQAILSSATTAMPFATTATTTTTAGNKTPSATTATTPTNNTYITEEAVEKTNVKSDKQQQQTEPGLVLVETTVSEREARETAVTTGTATSQKEEARDDIIASIFSSDNPFDGIVTTVESLKSSSSSSSSMDDEAESICCSTATTVMAGNTNATTTKDVYGTLVTAASIPEEAVEEAPLVLAGTPPVVKNPFDDAIANSSRMQDESMLLLTATSIADVMQGLESISSSDDDDGIPSAPFGVRVEGNGEEDSSDTELPTETTDSSNNNNEGSTADDEPESVSSKEDEVLEDDHTTDLAVKENEAIFAPADAEDDDAEVTPTNSFEVEYPIPLLSTSTEVATPPRRQMKESASTTLLQDGYDTTTTPLSSSPRTPKDRYLMAVQQQAAFRNGDDGDDADDPLTPMSPKDRYLMAVRQAAAKGKSMLPLIPDGEIVTTKPLTLFSHGGVKNQAKEETQHPGSAFAATTRSTSESSYNEDSLYYDNKSIASVAGSQRLHHPRFISASPTVATILMEAANAKVDGEDEYDNEEDGGLSPFESGSDDDDDDDYNGSGSPTKSTYTHDESTDGLPVKEQIDPSSPTRSYLQLDVEVPSSAPSLDNSMLDDNDSQAHTNNNNADKSSTGSGPGPIDTLRTSFAMIWNSKPQTTTTENNTTTDQKTAQSENYAQVSSPQEIATVDSTAKLDSFCQVPTSSESSAASTMDTLRSSLMMIWQRPKHPSTSSNNSTPSKGNDTSSKQPKKESPPSSKTKTAEGPSCNHSSFADCGAAASDLVACKRGRNNREDSDSASSPRRRSTHRKSRQSESLSKPSRSRSTSRDARIPMGSQYLPSSRGNKKDCQRSTAPVPSSDEPYMRGLMGQGQGKGSFDSTEEFQNQARTGSSRHSHTARHSAPPSPLRNVDTTDTEDSFINAALKAKNVNHIKVIYSGTPDTREWHPPEQERKEHDTMVRAILQRPSLIDKSNPEPHHQSGPNVRKWILIGLVFLLFVGTIAGCLACGITGKCVRSNDPQLEEVETVKPLVLQLPDYTLESLQSLHSAQTKAYLWLEDDPHRKSYGEDRMLQRFAMATLYYSTKIAQNWTVSTSWLSYDIHECYWFSSYEGMDVCEDDRLRHLVITKNNLRGNLPKELALLTSLEEIDLSRNVLIGSIPDQLANLTSLESLWLEKNELNGAIPSSLSALTNLTYLGLATNDLKGSIPTQLGMLTNLEKMRVFYNFLTGELPSELGLLTNLSLLDVDVNNLSGGIPTELGQLEKLEELWLDWNSFVGPIPTALGLLQNLVKLYLGRVFVEDDLRDDGWKGSGDYTIPSELGLLTNLEELYLDNNDLTGLVPTELSSLTTLERMTLDNNLLTDSIAPGICSLFEMELESLSVDCSEVFCNCGCTCV